MLDAQRPPFDRDGFEIAVICALSAERDAIEALIDHEYELDGASYGKATGDSNIHALDRIGKHHVVLVYIPGVGTVSAAVALSISSSFRSIELTLVVNICRGVPSPDGDREVLLGDIIIGTSIGQLDFGRQYLNKFVRRNKHEDSLGRVNTELRDFVGKLSRFNVQNRLKENVNVCLIQLCLREGFSAIVYPGPENVISYSAEHRHKHWTKSCEICTGCRYDGDDVCDAAFEELYKDLGCVGGPVQN